MIYVNKKINPAISRRQVFFSREILTRRFEESAGIRMPGPLFQKIFGCLKLHKQALAAYLSLPGAFICVRPTARAMRLVIAAVFSLNSVLPMPPSAWALPPQEVPGIPSKNFSLQDYEKILAIRDRIREAERRLGGGDYVSELTQSGKDAAAFTSEISQPGTENLGSDRTLGRGHGDGKLANQNKKQSQNIKVRTLLNTSSGTIEKKTLIKHSGGNASFVLKLHGEKGFSQTQIPLKEGGEAHVYHRDQDTFFYTQKKTEEGSVQLKEWIHARRPSSQEGTVYTWNLESGEESELYQFEAQADGRVIVYRNLSIQGVAPGDKSERERVMQTVQRALSGKAVFKDHQKIAEMEPPVYFTRSGVKKTGKLIVRENQLIVEVRESEDAYPLLIDPTLQYGQWLGSEAGDSIGVNAIALETASDEIYVVGYSANGLMTDNVTFQGSYGGTKEGFVIEIADGTNPVLNWAQWLGGSGIDEVSGVAVNGNEIYAGGYSESSSSWESVTFQGTHSGGTSEGFVVEIADGATPSLNWGQWLGGTGSDNVDRVAVTGDEIYAAGESSSSTSWEGTFQGTHSGGTEGFIVEIADGTTPSIAWGQWLGGTGEENVNDLAVSGDEIYVVGYSDAAASWEGTFQGTFGSVEGPAEGFIVEIADGTTPSVAWGQWLGGDGANYPTTVDVNADEIYVAGMATDSAGWETVTFQGSHAGGGLAEGFVIEIADGATPTLNWGQWLGSSSGSEVYGVAVNGDEIYASGFDYDSAGWESVTFQGSFGGAMEGFVVEIADGATPSLTWAQWIGGSDLDFVQALKINGDEIYVTGGSSNPIDSWESVTFQGTPSPGLPFVMEIADGATPALNWGQWLGSSGNDQINSLAVTGDEIYAGGYSTTSQLWETITFQGTHSGYSEGFVIEIADGSAPVVAWGQWLGGTGNDVVMAVAVNGDEIYAAGYSTSSSSWESVTFQGTHSGGLTEGFVVEITDGTTPSLNWGQWLGGTGQDYLNALAVAGDEIYTGGRTDSSTSWEGTFQGTFSGGDEGFVVEIADGTTPSVAWGQWLGGTSDEDVYSIAVNGDEIYAGGFSTSSTSWEGTFQGTQSGTEGFVVEIADGATPSIAWGQWLGGTGGDGVNAVAVNGDEIYAAGYGGNATSWETVTFQGAYSGADGVGEGFVIEIADGATPTLNWGQWLGGTGYDAVVELAVVGDEIIAGGFSQSTTSWESVTFQGTHGGASEYEGFVLKIVDGASPSLIWGQWIGGARNDRIEGLVVNGNEIYAGGYSSDSSTWESVTFQGTFTARTNDGFFVEIKDGSRLSGTAYQSNESTALTGSSYNVAARVNGGAASTTTTSSADGSFTFNDLTVGVGDTVTVYFYGASDGTAGTYTGNVVTTTDGISDIAGVKLIDDHVVIRSDNGANAVTIVDMTDYDNDQNSANLLFDAEDSAPDTVSVEDGNEIYIESGELFTPGGNVDAGTGGIDIRGTWTATGAETINNAGSWNNAGTFTPASSVVTFDATASGNVLTGTMNGAVSSNNFYKIAFSGVGGAWTIQDPMRVTADATDTFVVGNGTVTLGNGSGDNLEVLGKMKIANAGETGTFQTLSGLAEGSSIILDINTNGASPPACTNCGITVGGASGSGTFIINKNAVLRLNPRADAATTNVGLEVESTGYLQILGTMDQTGSNDTAGTGTSETLLCLSDGSESYTGSQHNNKVVRMTSGLAFGRIYDITATTAADGSCTGSVSSITRATTASSGTTISNNSGTLVKTITLGGSIAASTDVGRYLKDTTNSNKYYKIVRYTSGTSIDIIAEPDNFTGLANSDSVVIVDGVKSGDTYEIYDYASVRAESDTCQAATDETDKGEAYILGKAGSETVIRYGHICNMGTSNATDASGLAFNTVDGSVSNQGTTIEKSWIKGNYYGVFYNASSNNNTAKGIRHNYISESMGAYPNHAVYVNGGSKNDIVSNRIYSSQGVYFVSSIRNTISSNIIYDVGNNCLTFWTGANANSVTSNTLYSASVGIGLTTAHGNELNSNVIFAATSYGLYNNTSSNNNLFQSNSVYASGTGAYLASGTKGVYYANTLYSNSSYGFNVFSESNFALLANNVNASNRALHVNSGSASTGNVAVNNNFGTVAANSTADIVYAGTGAHALRLYNTTLSSTTKVSGVAIGGAYILSRKHDGANGVTKLWGDYTHPTNSTETPQDETTDKYNYADNLWEKSATPHGYSGTGTEDTNLNYDLSTADLSAGPYAYRAVYNGTNWDVTRNGTSVGTATTNVLFTDTNASVNVKFKIDSGGVAYAAGAVYTFAVWDASGDTNTQKSLTIQQSFDSIQINSGNTIQFNGQSAGVNLSTLGILTPASMVYDITVNVNGTLSGNNNLITVTGHVTGTGGTINLGAGSSFIQRVFAAKNFGTTNGAVNWTFQDLNFENSGGAGYTITTGNGGTGQIITNGTLTIGKATDSFNTTLDNETYDRIIDANDALSITSKGVLQASSTASFTVGGDWNNDGTFTSGTGTVTFNKASGTQVINDSNNWNGLAVTGTAARTVQFESTKTQTIAANGSLTFTGASGQLLTLAPTVAATTWLLNVNATGVTQSVTYTSPTYSDASSGGVAVTATGGTNVDGYPGGTNTNWNFGGITLAGTARQNDETTLLTGSSYNVAVRVNGGAAVTTTTSSADGSFLFSGVPVSAGDTVTMYFYGASDAAAGTYTGNVVTITNGTSAITGMKLMDDHVVIRSDNGATAATILDLVDYDNDNNAANLLFTATDATPDTLSVEVGNELHIESGELFTPGGNVTASGGVDIQGTWTATGTETIGVVGNWNVGASAAFVSATSTVTFSGDPDVVTGGTDSNHDFHHVTINTSSGNFDVITNDMDINGDLTFQSGWFSPTANVYLSGNVIVSSVNWNGENDSGYLIFDGAGLQTITNSVGDTSVLADVTVANVSVAGVRMDNSVSLGNFVMNANAKFDCNGYDLTVNSGGGATNFTLDSTSLFITGSNTVTFAGGNPTTITSGGTDANHDFNHVRMNLATAASYLDVLTDDVLINGDLTLSSGKLSPTTNIRLKGNLIVDATTVASETDNGDLIFEGTSLQTITNSAGESEAIAEVQISNTTGVRVDHAMVFTSTAVNSNAILNLNGNNYTSATAFTNAGTLQLTGDETVSTPTNNSGSTVEYTATSGSRDIKDWTYTNATLKINGTGGTFSLPGAKTVAGLTVSAGTFDLKGQSLTRGASGAAVNNGTIRLYGNETLTNFTNFDIDSGTVEYTGDRDSVNDASGFVIKDFGATDYYHLAINSTDANDTINTAAASPLTVAGNLSFVNGTFDNAANDNAINVSGNLTADNDQINMGDATWTVGGNWDNYDVTTFNRDASTLLFSGGTSNVNLIANSGGSYFENVTVASGKTVTCTQNTNIEEVLTVSGTVSVDSTKQIVMNDTSSAPYNDLKVTGTGLLTGSGRIVIDEYGGISQQDGTINIATLYISRPYSASVYVAGTYASPTVTIEGFWTGSSAHDFVWQTGTYTFEGDVEFISAATTTLNVVNNTNNPNLVFKGNVSMDNDGTATINWTKGTGTITLSAGGASTDTINFFNKTVEDIVVNDSDGGAKNLTADVTTDSFTLSAGTLGTKGYELTSVGNFTVSGGTLDATDTGGEGDTSYIYIGGNVDFTGGDFTEATSTIVHNGTGTTTFTSAAEALNNLTINDGLVGYWKLDETGEGNCQGSDGMDACDASGNGNHGEWEGGTDDGTTVPTVHFNNPESVTFDGVDGHINITETKNLPIYSTTNPYSVAFWVKAASGQVATTIYGEDDVPSLPYFQINTDNDDGANLRVVVKDNAGAFPAPGVESNAVVFDNTWHHVVWTDQAGTAKVYIDGVQDTADFNYTPTATTPTKSYLGRSNFYFNGSIDEVRVYKRVLTAEEVAKLASGTHPSSAASGSKMTLEDTLDVNGSLVINSGDLDNKAAEDNAINVAGSWWNNGGKFTNDGGTVTIDGTSGTNYVQGGNEDFYNLTVSGSGGTWVLNQDVMVTNTWNHSAGTVNTNTYDLVVSGDMTEAATVDWSSGTHSAQGTVNLTGATITPGTSTLLLNPNGSKNLTAANKALNNVAVTSTDGLVGWWKLDETALNTCNGGADDFCDSSGNANHGDETGSATITSAMAPLLFSNMRALAFDGTDDVVTVTTGFSGLTTQTYAAWIYQKGVGGGSLGRILHKRNNQYGLGSLLVDNSAATMAVKFEYGHDASNAMAYRTADNVISLNKWTHVALTFNGSDFSQAPVLYVNGVPVSMPNIVSIGTPNPANDDNALYLGNRQDALRTWDGFIDDVRIYNRVLTAEEIKALAGGHPLSSTGTVTLQDTMDVNGHMVLGDGTFAAGANTIKVAKNWYNSAATFTYGTSTVDFDDDAQANTIFGDTTFYNLTVSTAAAKTVTFESGKTTAIANSGTLTLTGASGQLLTLSPGTAATTWKLNVSATGTTQNIQYVRPTYSDASLGTLITAGTGSADASPYGTNINWDFPGIIVSGTARQNDETTLLTGSSYNVGLRVNGGTVSTTTTNSSDGTWGFGSVTAAAGDTVTIYFYGASDSAAGTYTGNIVGITNGTSDVTGLKLMDDHVVIRSDNGATATTILDLVDYDNDNNAANLLFTATDATPDTLSVEVGNELHIESGELFTPGGNVTVDTGGLDLKGTWTATGTETLQVTDGNFNTTGGTFTPASSTVTLANNNSTATYIYGNTTFNHLIITGTSYLHLLSDNITVNGNLTISNSYNHASQGFEADGSETPTIQVKGNVVKNNQGAMTSAITIQMNGTSQQTITTSGTRGIGSLKISNTSASVLLASNLKMIGSLTIDPSATLDCDTTNNYSISMEGYSSGLVWTNSGTFTPRQGTVNFVMDPGATYSLVSGTLNFYNLTLSGSGNGSIYFGDDVTVANDFIVSRTYDHELIFAEGAETHLINVAGNASNTSTHNLKPTLTLVMNGTGTQTITTSSDGYFGDVQISNTTGSVQLAGNLYVNDDISAGVNTTFNLASYGITGTASTSWTNLGTIQLQGDQTFTNATPTNTSTSTVEYTATTGTRNIKDWTYQALKINGSGGTFTMGAGETLSGDLTVSAGTLDAGTQTLAINGNTVINGGTLKTGTNTVTFGNAGSDSVTISSGALEIKSDNTATDIVKTAGTWTNSGGTIYYNNTAGSISTFLLSSLSPYNHLTVDSPGSTYSLNNAIVVNGNLTLTAGTLDVNSSTGYNINLGGNWTNSTGAFTPRNRNVTFNGTGIQTVTTGGTGVGKTFNNVTKSAAGTVNLAGDIYAGGTFTQSGGTFATKGYELTSVGNFTVSSGTLDATDTGGEGDTSYIYIGGSVDFTGGAFTPATSTIVHNGTGATTFTSAGKSLNNVIVNDGLVGYWKLDETAADGCAGGTNDSCDSSGYGYDGAWNSGATASTTVPTLLFVNPRSTTFNGSTDYISTSDINAMDSISAITVSAWVNFGSVAANQVIAGKWDGSSGFGLQTGASANANDLCFFLNSSSYVYTNNDVITTGTWYHVAGTFDNALGTNKHKIYLNGVSQTLTSSGTPDSLTSTPASTGVFNIGRLDATLGRYLNGKIDDVRVYNRALTAAEIEKLASGTHPSSAASGSKMTLEDALDVNGSLVINSGDLDNKAAEDNAINVSGSWWNNGGKFTNDGGTVTIDGTSGTNYVQGGNEDFYNLTVSGSGGTWVLNQDVMVTNTWNHSAGTVNTNTYDLVVSGDMTEAATVDWSSGTHSAQGAVNLTGATITAGTSTLLLNPNGSKNLTAANKALNNVAVTSTDGLVGWWKLDETAMDGCSGGQDFCDATANGNHGTETGSATISTSVAPVNFSNARGVDFDGVDDVVNINPHASINDLPALTVLFWAKLDTLGLSRNFVSKADNSSGGHGWLLTSHNSTSSALTFSVPGFTTSDLSANTSSGVLVAGEWVHLAVTWNGSQYASTGVKIYKNGTSLSLTTVDGGSTTPQSDSGRNLRFGQESGIGSNFLDGVIDDVRVYNRVLTAEEIKALAGGHPLSSTGTVTLQDTMDVNGHMVLGDATFAAGANTIKVAKNWYNSAATFTYGTSTVDFDDDAQANTIFGDTTFYNLTVSTAAAKTVTFESGKTTAIANSGTLTLTGASGQLLTLSPGTAATTWKLNVSATGTTQNIQYVTPTYSDASLGTLITAGTGSSDGTPNATNINWDFPGIIVSGTARQNDETTLLTGSSYNVALRVNGGTVSTTTTNSSDGTWGFSTVTASAGDTVTIYFYGASDSAAGTYTGNIVGITNGTSDVTGLKLMDDHVVIRSDNGATATTILDLVDYDNDNNAANLLFTATDATPDTLSVEVGNELHIESGELFTPGGNVTSSGGVDIQGTWTATGSETIASGSTWNVAPSAVFSAATTTVTFSGGSSRNIVTGGTDDNHDFNNVVVNLAGDQYKFDVITNDMDIDGDLTVSGGTLSLTTNITLAGNLIVTGTTGQIGGLDDNGDIIFDGAALQTITNSQPATSRIADFRVTNSSVQGVRMDHLIHIGDFTMDANARFDCNGNNLSMYGDVWTVDPTAVFITGANNVAINGGNGTVVNTGGTDDSHDFNNVSITLDGNTDNFDVVTYDMDIDGNLTFNNGRFSPTTNVYLAGNLSITGDNTITSAENDTGDLIFDGTSLQTITNSAAMTHAFAEVQISNATGVRVDNAMVFTSTAVNSNAILNLNANNYTSATAFTNSGTIQLTGDETVSTPTNNSGATVEYTATSGTRAIKDWTYHHLKINGSGGTFTMGAGESLAGDLTATAGIFDVNDQTLTINGNTLINGATMKSGTNTVTFGDVSGTDTVTISGGTLEIESDNTTLDIVKDAGTWTNSGGTIKYNAATVVSTSIRPGLGTSYNNLVIDSTGSTYTLGGGITVNGDFSITSGTLDADAAQNRSLTVKGNFTNSGTFLPRLGTVTFNGTGTQTVTTGGSGTGKTFNNIIKSAAGTVNLAGDMYAGGTFAQSGGAFATKGYELTSVGNFTVSSGTLDATDTGGEGDKTYFYLGGNVDFTGGDFTEADSTIVHNGTAATTFTSASEAVNNFTLNDGLVGYWKLDESAANTCVGGANDACDSSGYGYDGAWTSGATSSTTVPALLFSTPRSVTFDGTDDYVLVNSFPVLDGANKMSVSVWLKPAGFSSSGSQIFARMKNDVASELVWSMRAGNSGDADLNGLHCFISDGSGYPRAYVNNALTQDVWQHIAFVYDGTQGTNGGKAKIYKNGVLLSASYIGTIPSSMITHGDKYFTMGDCWATGSCGNWNGQIDEARVYNRVLTDAEIQKLANGALPGASASGSSVTLQDGFYANGNVVINSGELIPGINTIDVIDSWYNNGGKFTSTNQTVRFPIGGPSTSYIQAGNQSFASINSADSSNTHVMLQDAMFSNDILISSGTLDTNGYDTVTTDDMTVAGTLDMDSGVHSVMGSVNLTGATITAGTSNLVMNPSTGAETLTAANKAINNAVITSTDGLVGWWKMDETAMNGCAGGQDFCDTTANGNHGVESNTPTISTNTAAVNFANARALEFNGSNTRVDVSPHSSINTLGPLTYAAWVRPAAAVTGSQSIINKRYRGLYINNAVSPATVRLFVSTSTTNMNPYCADSNKALPIGQWTHVAVTWDGVVGASTTGKFYVNGQECAFSGETGSGTTYSDSSNNLTLGAFNDGTTGGPYSEFFNGTMDDVRIYNRMLLPEEIKALSGGHPLSSTGTITLQDTMDVNGSMILGDGTFAAGANTIKVAKNWTNSAATFTAGTSTVDFDDDTQNNTISGNSTFYNLTVSSGTAKTVTWQSVATQTIAASGTLTLTGSAGQLLTLSPGTAATAWNLNVNASANQSISYVSVTYSDASGGSEVNAADGTNTDGAPGGTNVNWNFGNDTSSGFLTFF